MPFANLPPHEKDAFFSLLDEYFTSRPDLLSRVGGAGVSERSMARSAPPGPPLPASTPGASTPGGAMTAVAQRAIMKNPADASRLLVAGLKHANSSPAGSSGNATAAAAAQHAIMKNPAAASRLLTAGLSSGPTGSGNSTAAASNNNHASGFNVGRVAQAFSPAASPPPKSTSPPVANKLVPNKKFGDVDVSSAGAMFRSLRGSTAAKNAPPPTVYTPPAFPGKASSGLPPPPKRRVSASAAHVPEPEEDYAQPESTEEEEAGEWAEALYDYTSGEASDLHLRAGERILVTEKTSSDWWTGEVEGRSGLFPALYVKLL